MISSAFSRESVFFLCLNSSGHYELQDGWDEFIATNGSPASIFAYVYAVNDASASIGVGWPRGWETASSQQVQTKARWSDGRWRMVMIRPLTTSNNSDVQFGPGSIIPIAFNAWDGSNGEHGMIMGLSTWHLLYLNRADSDMFNRMETMLWFFGISSEYSPQ